MREPGHTETADHTKYQRNITIAGIHQASPIDEKRAAVLEQELVKNFSADASISDFKILEHKFFNYRGANDGLLVYSSLKVGDYAMMQMHILVSGGSQQLLLTYTDLAAQFGNEKDPAYSAAWDSMVSAQLEGDTPSRQAEYLRYGEIAGCIFVLLAGCFFRRLRASRRDYKSEADAMIDSEDGLPAASMRSTRGARKPGPGTSSVSAISAVGTFSHTSPASAISSFGTQNNWNIPVGSRDWPRSRHAAPVQKAAVTAKKVPAAPAAPVARPASAKKSLPRASHLSAVSALSDFDFE